MRERLQAKKGVPPLSEKDIQNRLYGEFLGEENKKEDIPPKDVSPTVGEPPCDAKAPIFKSEGHNIKISRRIILMVLFIFLGSMLIFERATKYNSAKAASNRAPRAPAPDPRLFGAGARRGSGAAPRTAEGPKSPQLYTIQACVYEDKSGAEKRAAQLKDKGFLAFLVETKSSKGRSLYKICVGEFASAKEASPVLVRLQTEERLKDSYLRRR